MRPTTKKAFIIFGTGIIILVALLLIANWLYSITVDDADKHYETGKKLRDEGRLQEAIAKFQRAIRSNPNHRNAWFYLGLTYEEAGRKREARDAWQKYIDLARDITAEELDLKVALSHIEALDHPERYQTPPPPPLPPDLISYDNNHDGRLDGFDWNAQSVKAQEEILRDYGVPGKRTDHVRKLLSRYYLSDRVIRRLLNLQEDLYSYDPNLRISDVVDQYLFIGDFVGMDEQHRDAFLLRNKIEPEELILFKSKILGDAPAVRANIPLRDEIYYLKEWGLIENPERTKFLRYMGLDQAQAERMIKELDDFYANPSLRHLRLYDVYAKLRSTVIR